MGRIRVAILGSSGIGKFHAREFDHCGADVCAILGSSVGSAIRSSRMLREKYGVVARPYADLGEMFRKEDIDAVSICTPPQLHQLQIEKCLSENVHVLCEKPLVQGGDDKNYLPAEELVEMANQRGKVLTVNTQWASFYDFFKIGRVTDFYAYFEPGVRGIEMLRDHLPHFNSLLIPLVPNGNLRNLRVETDKDDEKKIRFEYSNKALVCEAVCHMKFKSEGPRRIVLSFDGEEYEREVEAIGESYEQYFRRGGERIRIEDPLRVSIKKFLSSVSGKGSPLVGPEELLENVKLQDEIVSSFKS